MENPETQRWGREENTAGDTGSWERQILAFPFILLTDEDFCYMKCCSMCCLTGNVGMSQNTNSSN